MKFFATHKKSFYRQFFLAIFLISITQAFLFAQAQTENTVKSIQYRSQKVTSFQKERVTTNAVVYLDDGNVKIEYLSPEKRTLLLSGDKVYVFGETKEDMVSYKWSEVPAMVRAMLQPTIFAAADFMANINNETFQIKKTGKKSGTATIYEAIPKEQKNISKVEYLYDEENALVHSYKLISKEGAVISEVQFLDYKIYNDKYYFPAAIKTVINSAEGLIEDREEFSRVRVDMAIDKNIFKP